MDSAAAAAVVFYYLRVYILIFIRRDVHTYTHTATHGLYIYSVYPWTTSLFHCVGRCSREQYTLYPVIVRSVCARRSYGAGEEDDARFALNHRRDLRLRTVRDSTKNIIYYTLYIIRTCYIILLYIYN